MWKFLTLYAHKMLNTVITFKLQRLTLSKDDSEESAKLTPAQEMRNRIIKRAALEFKDGMFGIL